MSRKQKRTFQPRVISTYLSMGGVMIFSPNERARDAGAQPLIARVSIGYAEHWEDPRAQNDLATEHLSGTVPVPWRSADEREAALRILPDASWIDPDLRPKLIEHVRNTHWYDYEYEECEQSAAKQFGVCNGCQLVSLPDSIARSGYIVVPARRSTGNYAEVPGGVLDEMLRDDRPIPWLSESGRRDAMACISESRIDFRDLRDDARRRLLDHVARSPVWTFDREMRAFDSEE